MFFSEKPYFMEFKKVEEKKYRLAPLVKQRINQIKGRAQYTRTREPSKRIFLQK